MSTPDFSNVRIALNAGLQAALADGAVLTAFLQPISVVIAHAGERAEAFVLAADISEGDNDAYTVLLDDTVLHTIALRDDVEVSATVYDAQDGHREVGAVFVHGGAQVELATAHGTFLAEPALSQDIAAGDVIANGEFSEGCYSLYHTAAGYVDEDIAHAPYGSGAEEEVYEYGPDQVFFRVLAGQLVTA